MHVVLRCRGHLLPCKIFGRLAMIGDDLPQGWKGERATFLVFGAKKLNIMMAGDEKNEKNSCFLPFFLCNTIDNFKKKCYNNLDIS